MHALFNLCLAPQVQLSKLENTVVVESGARRLTLRQPVPGVEAVLDALAGDGMAPTELAQLAGSNLTEAYYVLHKLAGAALLSYAVWEGDCRLAVAEPLSAMFRLQPDDALSDTSLQLSRFALLRRDGDRVILESPLSHARIVLHDARAAAFAGALSVCHNVEVAYDTSGLTHHTGRQLLKLLQGTAMLATTQEEVARTGGSPLEDAEKPTPLATWEFHDLLFHARSRHGRTGGACGATYRFRDTVSPLPALKPAMTPQQIALYRPDMNQLAESDMTLTNAIESRRSVREYSVQGPTDRQLGELLYRSVRLKEVLQRSPQELCLKSYPSGGAIYELEFYPIVNQCQGLEAGLYHYDPTGHALEPLSGSSAAVEALLQQAYGANGQTMPQILIVMTARFGRISWKYQSIAYSLVLKHVGVVYQTLYLVATAMGLAPCALGSGDSDLFAQASGLSYYEESSVGEFMIGSHRMKSQ